MKGKLFGFAWRAGWFWSIDNVFTDSGTGFVHSSSFAAVDLSPWTYQREVKVTNFYYKR